MIVKYMLMNLIFSWLQHSALSIDIQQLCGWWVGNIGDGRVGVAEVPVSRCQVCLRW